jgi:hypothetical protein
MALGNLFFQRAGFYGSFCRIILMFLIWLFSGSAFFESCALVNAAFGRYLV